MSKQLSQMHSTKEQADAAKKVEKDVKVLKAKQNDERLSGMSLEAKLVERQGKVEQLEELKRVYEKEKDMKHEEVAKNLDSLKLELESKKCDLAAREVKVKALVAQGDSINMRNNSEIESGAATKHQLYNKCEEIANE
ncbi:hypothetical protein MKW94_027770, partial [Papaver nudicaule]|nr:hypothetical protein [Papaver nudicaule]